MKMKTFPRIPARIIVHPPILTDGQTYKNYKCGSLKVEKVKIWLDRLNSIYNTMLLYFFFYISAKKISAFRDGRKYSIFLLKFIK